MSLMLLGLLVLATLNWLLLRVDEPGWHVGSGELVLARGIPYLLPLPARRIPMVAVVSIKRTSYWRDVGKPWPITAIGGNLRYRTGVTLNVRTGVLRHIVIFMEKPESFVAFLNAEALRQGIDWHPEIEQELLLAAEAMARIPREESR